MRTPLPIDDILAQIIESLSRTPNLVLKAPTGAGKTVRVAPSLVGLDCVHGTVLLLEPRRVAARAAARRIAIERGTALGDEIGYHVRFDRKAGAATRLVAMTYGIFLRRLQEDPLLADVGAVVFDEFHERSLDADVALAIARKVQREVREDLRIVVMSATLDARAAAAFLGDAPVVESAGRQYPIEIRHRAIEDPKAADRAVAATVRSVLDDSGGDVLVFLPGVGEIRRVHADLEPALAARNIDVMDLYGDLPAEQQDAVLRRGPRRKVVLATNVAESSVTIENISVVVDSGLARVMRFDPRVGVDRLELARISRASADQRAGRAGRTGPGICIRLWSAHDDRALRPAEEPEIRRVDLSRAVLELKAWGEPDVRSFAWFEAPEPSVLDAAEQVLAMLGCLSGKSLTAIGRRLARLPLPPRVARLLIEAERLGIVRRAAIAAALLTERDPFRRTSEDARQARRPSTAYESDVLERVLALERFADAKSSHASADLSTGAARSVFRVARELETSIRGEGASAGRENEPRHAAVEERLLQALLVAFPDRVARRRAPGSDRAVMVGGRGVRLSAGSVVATAELFVCVAVDGGRRGERSESLVWQASAIERSWLSAGDVREAVELEFDEQTESVTGRSVTRYLDLVLDEKPSPAARDAASIVLAERAAAVPARALDLAAAETAEWLARARSLSQWMPELALPSFDDDALSRVARGVAAGKRSFAEMRRAPVLDALRAELTYEQLRLLERHAPERIAVPSGSSVRIAYEPGQPPVLAVRIQEVFGMKETPRVAAGRVAVVLHLLAPNRRPEQVTDDLASFWKTTYAQVRKELRARYPKHSWPEDPLTAVAEHRPRRKRS
ncbi:MAG TPA: ATP-dependent helicase HrpB [Candidatus Limnocylindrales bacterium]|nr:ATP-dependent helicase HrpB [Candidatus Limnocylindrales bacterium]